MDRSSANAKLRPKNSSERSARQPVNYSAELWPNFSKNLTSLLQFCACGVLRWFEVTVLYSRLGFKTCLSKTKTKTKTCLSKTKTKTQQFQDQDQDLLIQDQDSAVSRPRPRPRLAYPRPRPRLKTYKTNTESLWLGWTVTNKKLWQAENPAYQ